MSNLRRLAAIAALVFLGSANAQNLTTRPLAGASVLTLSNGGRITTYANGNTAIDRLAWNLVPDGPATAGKTALSLNVKAPLGTGFADGAMVVTRKMPWQGAARMAGKALGNPIAQALLLPLATILYEQVRCRMKAGDITKAVCDDGEPSITSECRGWGSPPPVPVGGIPFTCDAQAWCTAWANTPSGQNGQAASGYHGWSGRLDGTPYTSSFYCVVEAIPPGGVNKQVVNGSQLGPGTLRSTQSCRVGGVPGSRYNNCPSKTDPQLGVQSTWDEAADKFISGEGGTFDGGGSRGTWDPAPVIKEALEHGVDPLPFAEAPSGLDGILSGPSIFTGTPTTTTTAPQNGNPGTSVTTTPTQAVTYDGNSFTAVPGSTTATNNGTTTTTTTTTGSAPTPEQKVQCDKYPNSLGCLPVGDMPTAEAMPTKDAPISYAPTPFGGTAACPAGVPLDFTLPSSRFSKSTTLSYQPLCDVASGLAPIFLALFAASAAMIFYLGVSQIKVN